MTEQRIYKCRCGSTEFETDGSGVSTCSYCGCKFVAQNGCTKFKILPETDEKQFLRSAWIHLAAEDATEDVFDCDLESVRQAEYQVMVDSVGAKVYYQASIGYDREEAYQETQNYNVRVPYTETSRVYDSRTKSYVNRSVTNYRTEERQRQVTKYRTVTYWTPFSSEHNAQSTICVRNGNQVYVKASGKKGSAKDDEAGLSFSEGEIVNSLSCFDGDVFIENLDYTKSEDVIAPNEDECERMKMSATGRTEARQIHNEQIETSLNASILGDHHKDLDYSVEIAESSTQLYSVPEYYTKFSYKRADYTIEGLPFGKAPVSGGEIENSDGLEAYRKKALGYLEEEKDVIEGTVSEDKWSHNKVLLILITVLFGVAAVGFVTIVLVNIGLYLPHRVFPLIVLAIAFGAVYVGGLVVYLVNRARQRRWNRLIELWAQDLVRSKEEDTYSDIDSYTDGYVTKRLGLLNKKLTSLGLIRATVDDISELKNWDRPSADDEARTAEETKFDKRRRYLNKANFILTIVAGIITVAGLFLVIVI